MSNAELIAEAKQKPSLLGDATVANLIRALEATEREMHMRELHHFESEEALAAAQAVIAEALACLEDADQGDSFGPIEDILSQSPTDALQAHDRQVAAKALTDAANEAQEQFNEQGGVGVARVRTDWLRARAVSLVPGNPEPLSHEYIGIAGLANDDECTFRADGTDLTYCGEPRGKHGAGNPEPTEGEKS